MAITTLKEKLMHGIGDIYDAEHRFQEAMQVMLDQASETTVRRLLEEHITQTQEQIGVLEQVYSVLGASPERVECEAAKGLVKEGQKTLKEASENAAVRDCVIADASAKVEHYEIATYRGLIATAEQMGKTEVVQLLQQNLQQEERTAQNIEQNAPVLLQQAMVASQERVS